MSPQIFDCNHTTKPLPQEKEQHEKLTRLEEMGFPIASAAEALISAEGDFDVARERLMDGGAGSSVGTREQNRAEGKQQILSEWVFLFSSALFYHRKFPIEDLLEVGCSCPVDVRTQRDF